MDNKQFPCCGGKSCKNPGDMNRRDFIKTAALAAGGLGLMGLGGAAAFADSPVSPAAWAEWTATLWERGTRRVYRGDELDHIAMPMGGVGAGQLYITGRGALDQWQIVNNFNSNAHASGGFFTAWTKTADGEVCARLLQQGDDGAIPGVTAVEFSGEYPFAWLRYLDGALPIDLSLEVFSPFILLDTKNSALPAVVFRFTAKNRGAKPVETALMASAPNLVGWDGYAPLDGVTYPDYIANVNTFRKDHHATTALLAAREGTCHAVSLPCDLITNSGSAAQALRYCGGVTVRFKEAFERPQDKAPAVVWLGEISDKISDDAVAALLDAVHAGLPLITTGPASLLLATATQNVPQDYEVFEDWSADAYRRWKIQGDCFGAEPATGKIGWQQDISGRHGKRFVNTFSGTDDTTGRATSRPFQITKRYIHLTVGGGHYPGETCVNLLVDGHVAATATGENTEHFRDVTWDVSQLRGKRATIEIVDSRTGGWGHILVGDIVFSDSPVPPGRDPRIARRTREALPFTWTRAIAGDKPARINDAAIPGLQGVMANPAWRFEGFTLKPGARVILQAEDGAPLVIEGPCGAGHVIVCNGAITAWAQPPDRKAVAGSLVARARGAEYQPMTGWTKKSPFYGSMALAALHGRHDHETISARPQWDNRDDLWKDFADDGQLDATGVPASPSAPGRTWNTALCRRFKLHPGEERQITFVLAWHFPNRMRDSRYGWGPGPYQMDYRLGNQYNNWFADAGAVANYVAQNFHALAEKTMRFHTAFYDSTLPRWFLDGITANMASIRCPIYIWLEDGTFAGFEGADSCCPMNCTHVYNYVMSTAYMFPALERNVRETDLLVQMNPVEHYIPHRTVLPLSLPRLGNEIGGPEHHALDGELGTILKTYREWRQCGDQAWLEKLWPHLKLVMQHVLRDHDVDGDGVIKGEQPDTYDTHVYGSNTFIGTLYLAALRATEQLANVMGDPAFAGTCHARFEKGAAGYDRRCWNGEYYYNAYDMPGAGPDQYNQSSCWGPGCFSDQVLGQWWVHIVGLGHVLPREHLLQAIKAVHKYNWRADLTHHVNHQRVFASGTEKGLLNCTWPNGGRVASPILYCDEVWTGIEYHVAATLLYNGLVAEALEIAKGARDRYTGNQRNPWAEIECGHHYSRAMSAHSLLLAASGYDYHAAEHHLGFAPRLNADDFKSFFSAGTAWGTFAQQRATNSQDNTLTIQHGALRLNQFTLELPRGATTVSVTAHLGIHRLHHTVLRGDSGLLRLIFAEPAILSEKKTPLTVRATWT